MILLRQRLDQVLMRQSFDTLKKYREELENATDSEAAAQVIRMAEFEATMKGGRPWYERDI
jgi:hypothetical protein